MNSDSRDGWPIRGPREMLAGCVWLARFSDKVRLHQAGRLPSDFARFLGHPRGVDGHFLRHFGLLFSDTFNAIVDAGDDSRVERWFLSHHNAFQSEIKTWNNLAPNLGRAGFPAEPELQLAINRIMEPEAVIPGISTIFEAIELDDIAIIKKHSDP